MLLSHRDFQWTPEDRLRRLAHSERPWRDYLDTVGSRPATWSQTALKSSRRCQTLPFAITSSTGLRKPYQTGIGTGSLEDIPPLFAFRATPQTEPAAIARPNSVASVGVTGHNQAVVSTFGWLDTDNEQRRKMLEVVDLFKEEGTVDELGHRLHQGRAR